MENNAVVSKHLQEDRSNKILYQIDGLPQEVTVIRKSTTCRDRFKSTGGRCLGEGSGTPLPALLPEDQDAWEPGDCSP